jgi:hypothetical protein
MKNQGIFNKGIYGQTPAHELGHGAFGLKHTFDSEYGISDNPQITLALNLMGYNDQAHLAKFQWDIIHQHSGETAFDSTEEVMVTVMDADGNNGQPIDTAVANQKVKDLIIVLQQRIKEHLNNNTEKYSTLAYDNENVLPSITQFDPTLGSGGAYKNGKLYVGTRNFKESSADEDILATLYHEYMHYLNWQFGDRYRMENLMEGKVYSRKVECYENRMQTETEFLNEAYLGFQYSKMGTPEAENYYDYPLYYNELTNNQKEEVDIYIKGGKIEPKKTCISYDYSPSNFFKDEINAHTETLNANGRKVFNMSDNKIILYKDEIDRYMKSYNKAKTYEINNNINSNGYEK